MLFATFDYFLFLPVVAIVHWLLRDRPAQQAWILAASVLFYSAWNPWDTAIITAIIAVTYGGALWVESRPAERRSLPTTIIVLALVAPLLYYKYLNFAVTNLRLLWPALPEASAQRLPIGISFYTFQAIAYVIDVRRGQTFEKNFLRFSTFILFFPHLIAGPILRASVLLGQLTAARGLSREDVGEGIFRLTSGLTKKLLIADVLQLGIVDSVFTDPGAFTPLEVLVALYAYTLQIYCDFSGYTDMAIGSARLLGFQIPENFDRPYQALTVSDYWRRWHITLSDWVRDYVYHPMGGSRVGGWKVYRNTFVTLMILAIWHGANWTFVLYGAIHGVAVSLNRFLRQRRKADGVKTLELDVWGTAWRWALTFHFVVLARILFRADSITQAGAVADALLQPFEWVMPRYSVHAWAVLAIGYLVHFLPKDWMADVRRGFSTLPAPLQGAAIAGAGAACVYWGVGDSLSFIYYSF
jgi:alginate O-acetyltransferase complex protein AlgI